MGTISCAGDCECPLDVSACTLSASGKDSAKDSVLSCGSSSECAIHCVGESSFGGNSEIRGDEATAQMSVLCDGKDACKGNTLIHCGSVTRCQLHCDDATSCEDAAVDARNAAEFECSGFCGALGQIKTADSHLGVLQMQWMDAMTVTAMAFLFCCAMAFLCQRMGMCGKSMYAKVEVDDSEEFTQSDAEEILISSD